MYNKPIRRTQMITPWGVGTMCNFPGDESLMVCGLDAWNQVYLNAPDGSNEFMIKEERLEKRLGVSHFRLPPDYREPGAGVLNSGLKVPFIRFPQWHYCPKCGAMEKLSIFGTKQICKGPQYSGGYSCHSTPQRRRPWLIPSRFITICERGHIEDFPFMEWVHRGQSSNEMCKLRLRAGRSASSLSGVMIECTTCKIMKSMTGTFNVGSMRAIDKTCSGQRPWLGEIDDNANSCGQDLKVVQRGASNVYFPHIISSIHLPRWKSSVKRRIVEILENNWSILTRSRIDGKLNKEVFEAFAERFSVNVDDLLNAAYERLESENTGSNVPDTGDSEEQYRKSEYYVIKSSAGGENQDFFSKNVPGNEYLSPIKVFFRSISLIFKLTETRALVGFSRFLPEDGKSQSEMKAELSSSKNIKWLPAITVKGEGILFEFDQESLQKWLEKPSTFSRYNQLTRNYNRARQAIGLPERPLNPRFVLIHTFSHILINQFSYICGYGSSALRERMYCDCNPETPDDPMNAVLIYTSSGDTEGSLGGLVRQGNPKNLEDIVVSALNSSKWCSSDPICINSPGQGPDSCNLAACHNCALLPETCCEEGNRLLDRALVTGTPDNPEIGYFHGFDE